MREILYIEIPTPDIAAVRSWLQEEFEPGMGQKLITSEGFRLRVPQTSPTRAKTILETPKQKLAELSAFVWSVQRTTYLKVFRWGGTLDLSLVRLDRSVQANKNPVGFLLKWGNKSLAK
jgi:lycopene cyclase CruA